MTSIHVLHKIYLLSTKSLPETHTFRWRELDSETFSSLALLRLKGRFSYWRGPVWSRRPQPIAEQHWRTVRTPGVIFTYAQLDMLANYRFQTKLWLCSVTHHASSYKEKGQYAHTPSGTKFSHVAQSWLICSRDILQHHLHGNYGFLFLYGSVWVHVTQTKHT